MAEQARVKIVCPECGGPLPAEAASGVVTCGRCGHSSAPAEPVYPCPRCKVSLFEGKFHSADLRGCGICGGLFLDNEASTRITRAHDSIIANLAYRASANAIATEVDTRPKNLPCPACAAPMKRVLARGLAEVDFCDAHGTWFDRRELIQVMSAYASGGNIQAPPRDGRAEAEVQMAAFRERQIQSIEKAEEVSALGMTVGVLGILAALAAGTKT